MVLGGGEERVGKEGRRVPVACLQELQWQSSVVMGREVSERMDPGAVMVPQRQVRCVAVLGRVAILSFRKLVEVEFELVCAQPDAFLYLLVPRSKAD